MSSTPIWKTWMTNSEFSDNNSKEPTLKNLENSTKELLNSKYLKGKRKEK